ncbi:hypothetical protein [Clavibacter michiganensis]|uniref:hypothetical protein n=1 Tax=Clavibacter michiganensis TaxID=28447 RepID=UPI000A3BC5D3|nr:hypothetical protein [Clavibacter michiganensis]MDO4100083.1 hypothetical protein [Clavibacter michiganensis]MDO4128539.1 hypothetical protein [Clavibacter michiganensis]NIY59092.1 hypothetical protein [Clavibacter michiganensis subsp. michiganensis]OUE29131.1 hypothetical protein CMMCA001_00165 [Clavibacter michiganensis subsp. michiganensis]QXP03002.1 hypothetical protein KN218_00815 [Clavibacter michiganensis subsp. michiganensis]
MAEISAAEYAKGQSISARRVQAAAAAGVLPARKIAGRWVIDAAEARHDQVGRPLSSRSVRALLARLSGDDAWRAGLSASEASRVIGRLTKLRDAPNAAEVLAAWMRSARPAARSFLVADEDLEDLRADPRLVAGGISDLRSGLSDARELEAHVHVDDLDPIIHEYLLVSGDRPNVLLHVQERPVQRPLLLGELIADLSQHRGPRERAAAAHLLGEVA